MPDKNNKMDISILHNADLVIGQYVSFVVTLSSDKPIIPAKSIIIKNASNNIQLDQISVPLVLGSQALTAYAQLRFTVLKEVNGNPVKDGASITFEVDTDATVVSDKSGFQPIKFAGTANEIDINSLALFVEKPYLQVPLDGSQSKPTAIYTTLRNKSTHKPLIGTPVFITSQQKDKIEQFDFKDADNKKQIVPEKVGPSKGLVIASNKDGLVKFYLYPRLSLVNVLTLLTIIPGNINGAMAVAKNIIYAVNYSNPGYMNSIGIPSILGNTPNGLIANGGEPDFLTIINSYPGASIGDVVIFFVENNYTGQSVTILNPEEQFDKYKIKLPYSIFKQGKPSDFSYAAISSTGDVSYSVPIKVTYLGGIPYEPEKKVERDYKLCITHTSLGVGPDNIIPPDNDVSHSSIMKYPGYKHDGLFVEIVRSNTNIKGELKSVPLNITEVTLNMYVNADNKSFIISYTTPISLQDIGGQGGNPDSIFFHIPYDDIVGVEWSGNISFDYQFFQDETVQYSAVWSGFIGTVPNSYSDNN
ncbi:hypothetical protein [Xenorhabdus sp. IM139775]|uniref:hypothetical protein n=1 Tax=Xenorhabdus sp. IM139775 TaxID=3025876 RepID=UPI002358D0D2|nr:hypothetical protein [Xenorhabdus sp. IM139775]MDC9593267.1 hypothetical protein [Xenorhabdus sp. IM139775]